MTRRRFSVKARLALLCGALFLLSGAVMLCVNYLLVRAKLPAVPDATAPPPGTPVTGGTSVQVSGTPAADGAAHSGVVSDGIAQYRASVLSTLLVESGVTIAVTLVLALALGWLVANRVLRPVRQVASTARKLSADSLDQRIRMDGPRDELTELADTFDEMLDRLAASFDSQRRFVANASHELRTPLAAQRTLVEVARARPGTGPSTRELCDRLLQTNIRVESLIQGLLVLARSDRGLDTRHPMRLDEVVTAILDGERPRAAAAGITLRSAVTPRTVHGDQVLIEQLVTNLVDNALKYNHPGGEVTVSVGAEPALRVVNTGPSVPAGSAAGLFEPFRQLRRTPSGAGRGAGLGLSIVASIARAHGGSARAEPRPGGGLEITLSLPEI